MKGAWKLWGDLPEPVRRELRAIYRDLRREYRVPPSRLSRRLLKAAAEAWAVADAVSGEAAQVALARRGGRGRRPSAGQVRTAAKRQGLQLLTLREALGRLEALAGARRPPTPDELLDAANRAIAEDLARDGDE
ncbi:MAG: hypothetical protein A3G44_15640 [Candidatus Rokubacteria bacterium RIFCSPLOWO2_12_FULL_73_47]|nr:MAG: hypothetical protein A3G44_15640 [Candidatus Rokubacteria bacterium RIFCSPLOWO2_12_FULL_73_47]